MAQGKRRRLAILCDRLVGIGAMMVRHVRSRHEPRRLLAGQLFPEDLR